MRGVRWCAGRRASCRRPRSARRTGDRRSGHRIRRQRLDSAVFNAIHEKGLKLIDDKSILEWATAQGLDAKKFSDAYSSFGVVSKVKRADQMAQASKIRGVPALVVDGRYLVTGQEIKSHADQLALTDKVIDKTRSERNLKKK